jgi:hypothetical protein
VLQAIAFRPRDARAPLAIGTAYVTRGTSDIVRLSLTFTRSALLDKRIEALSVVLENELVEGRFWLPRRQEMEVQRGGTVFDFPARGIVRARWNICCYDLRLAAASMARTMGGSGIVFLPQKQLERYAFEDSLFTDMRVDAAAVHPEDVAMAQAQARELVARRMLARPPGAAFAATSISDLLRFDRAEGFAAGIGGALRVGGAAEARVQTRYGFADERAKGELSFSTSLNDDRTVRMFAEREYRDVSDRPETSGAQNSLAAQEFASDRTDPFDVRGAGLEISTGRRAGFRWRVRGEAESERPLSIRAQPVSGTFLPIVAATPGRSTLLSVSGDGGNWQPFGAMRLTADGELRFGDFRSSAAGVPLGQFVRAFTHATFEAPAGGNELTTETFAALELSNGSLPVQQRVFFGGPLTDPGYEFHQFVGRAGVSQRLELQRPTSCIPTSLGSIGRVPSVTKVGAYVQVVWIDPLVGAPAMYPAVGAGAELFSGLVRVDVARGLRRPGRHWTFDIDAGRAFWRIL